MIFTLAQSLKSNFLALKTGDTDAGIYSSSERRREVLPTDPRLRRSTACHLQQVRDQRPF